MFECIGQCKSNRPNKRGILLASKAFESLSYEEKCRATGDIYGMEEMIEETQDFIKSKEEELIRELGRLKENIRKYYTRAVNEEKKQLELGSVREEYITSQKFRLMFLRSESFDAAAAALKLARYFKEKYDLFGEEKLIYKIDKNDFSMEDHLALTSGAFYFTGTTDMAGRPICVIRRKLIPNFDVDDMKRAVFYMHQVALEDNEIAQRRGIVVLSYNLGFDVVSPTPAPSMRKIFHIPRMCKHAMPRRVAAFHNCYDDIREHFMINMSMVLVPNKDRARFQGHFVNSHPECLIALMSYGIDPTSLLFTPEGEFQQDLLLNNLEQHATTENAGAVVLPKFKKQAASEKERVELPDLEKLREETKHGEQHQHQLQQQQQHQQ